MQNFPTVRQTAQAKMFDLIRHTALSQQAVDKRQFALSDKDADRLKSRALASLSIGPARPAAANRRLGWSVFDHLSQMRFRKTQRHPILQSNFQ